MIDGGRLCLLPMVRQFQMEEVVPGYEKKRRNDRIIMLWQIQPDGRYWEDDDGFGAEPDEEVTLYAFLDENGNFDGPFRIYRVGTRKCCEE